MSMRTIAPLKPFAVLTAVFFLIAIPFPAAQSSGSIEGIVVQSGSSLPLANAQVTLSGGAISAASFQKVVENMWTTSLVPPDAWFNASRQYLIQGKGLTPQVADQTLQKMEMGGGLPASPDNGRFEDEVFARVMNNTSLGMGVSPFNPEFGTAIKNLRAAGATFKMVTDRSGRFSFRNVPPGEYTVRVERDGYYGRTGSSLVPQTGAATVRVGSGTTTVEIPMVKGATISGRLRDELGQPIANATVQAFTVVYTNGLPALRAAAANKTNDRGDYSIFWLPGGEYYIAMVKASTQVVGGSFLQQVATTFYPGAPAVTEAVTVNVKTGDNVEGIDFINRPVRPVRVSGTVSTTLPLPQQQALPPGATAPPLENRSRPAVLMLLQRDPNAPDDVGARQVATVQVNMATGVGTFEVELMPGTYDLFGRMPNTTGTTNTTFGRVSFNVRQDDVKGLSIPIAAPQALNGTLTVNGAAPGQTGIRVSLQVDDSGAKLPAYGAQVRARLNEVKPDGTFTIPAVLVGHWQLYIEGLTAGMYVSDVRHGGRSIFDTGMDVGADPLNSLDVQIRNDGASLQGVVLDLDKKPLPKASVVLVPPENRRQNRQLYRPVTADEAGRFNITGIAPGNYKVFAWPGAAPGITSPQVAGTYFNPRYIARYEPYGRAVSVGQGGSPNLEITIPPID
jgi:hypothetical protein